MGRRRSRTFVPWWRTSIPASAAYVLMVFPIYILSKIVPKGDSAVYGSFNGFDVGDNGYESFLSDERPDAYFVTRNKSWLREDSRFIHIFSVEGIWRQLRAGEVYYSHTIDDLFAPAVVSSDVYSLSHGVPTKMNALADNRNSMFRFRFIRFVVLTLFPYADYYYCNFVYSPSEFFDEAKLSVYGFSSPKIVRSDLPRLVRHKKPKPDNNPKKILLAPTYRVNQHLNITLEKYGLYDPQLKDLLTETGYSIEVKPHYQDETSARSIVLPKGCSWHVAAEADSTFDGYSVLITDFSSIFYDAHILGLGVVFISKDMQAFETQEIQLFGWFREILVSNGATSIYETVERISKGDYADLSAID